MARINRQLVKAARELLGLTQAEFSAQSGISIITLRRFESGSAKASAVSDETLLRIQVALETMGICFVSAGDVCGGDGVILRSID